MSPAGARYWIGPASAPSHSSGPRSSATPSPGTRPPPGPPSSGSARRWRSSRRASASPSPRR
eukprot:14063841-Alexandrium_andersonii.AAC.1